MTRSSMSWDEPIVQYVLDHCLSESDPASALREETSGRSNGHMQISAEQGQFLAWLVKTLEVKQAIEVGVFTGYSALWVAEALPDNGVLVACEKNPEWIEVAKLYWEKAGVNNRVDVRIGDAKETLQALESGAYDLAFIDANKLGYDVYYELVLKLLRPGGVIMMDNMLQKGRVADCQVQDKITVAIREMNKKIQQDDRVYQTFLPLGDGVMMVVKV